jgi:hypothetical protein
MNPSHGIRRNVEKSAAACLVATGDVGLSQDLAMRLALSVSFLVVIRLMQH